MFERDAVMREAGRNVQNIAGQQFDIDDGFKKIGVQQRRLRGELPVLPQIVDAPAAPPGALANEDVVQIDRRPDPAAGRGVTDHRVVEAPFRDKRKRRHHLHHRRRPVIRRLHDQGPILFAQMFIRFKRPELGLPLPVFFIHQPRLDLGLARQTGQFIGADQIGEMFEPLTDHNRLLLPVMRKEVFK